MATVVALRPAMPSKATMHDHCQERAYRNSDQRFFEDRDKITRAAAAAVVPMVLKLHRARSVIDLGCGVGTWLAMFQEHGAQDVFGVDSSEVDVNFLQIDRDCFQPADLNTPYRAERTFDLAITLEVAEHLPPQSAPQFIGSLVHLAPVVLFSAAIPHQGGIHHVNEQWPQYWANLFAEHDYVTIDAIRRRIWQDDAIKGWYRQNILLFARRDLLTENEMLKQAYEQTRHDQLDLVHPQILDWKYQDYQRQLTEANELTLGNVIRMLPKLLRKSLASRTGQLWRGTFSSHHAK